MSLLNRSFAYSKMEKEDPEEVKHRRAQFLIYKALQQADSSRRRPSWLKVKTNKLKTRIGKRLKRLRKSILSTISAAEVGLHKELISQLKALKRLFRSKEASIVRLQPMLCSSSANAQMI